MVERLRKSGAIFVGKTNTPEFGFGSHTYNEVYGITRNAYDQSRSAGGSSGGAAVSLALRMLPLADGSDYGGSLRNPAGWNNVFGFRTSYGRVPTEARDTWLPSMGVVGPMARTVPDLAMLLAVQSGFDARAPLAIEGDGSVFLEGLKRDFKGKRIAWAGDFKGYLPYEPGVLEVCTGALKAFETLGCSVEQAQPDYPIDAVWRALVALRAWQQGGEILAYYNDPDKRALLKPEAIWEVETGLKLSAFDITAASVVRTEWYHAVRRFFARYDYFVLPTAQLLPFRRHPALAGPDRRPENDQLSRMDEGGVPHHHVGLPGTGGPGRIWRSRACRSACRSSAPPMASCPACNWLMPMTRRRNGSAGGRRRCWGDRRQISRQLGPAGSVLWKVIGPMPKMAITDGSAAARMTPS